MKHPIAGSVILITGASAGIGAATARLLASHGAKVILCARRAEELAAVRLSLHNPEQHLVCVVDVTDKHAVAATVAHAVTTFGRIDAVVCNAGIGVTGPIAELDYALYLEAMAVNVGGFLHLVNAVNPTFTNQRAGHYVVVSSVVGQHALPYNGGYAATKGALERLCEALRIETRGLGISVSVIRPGTVASEFFAHRIGPAGEHRRTRSAGMSPHVVAACIVRALRHDRRILYPRFRDQLLSLLADVFPAISDVFLARTILWHKKTGDDESSSPDHRT